ncbi:MAG: right-handed parallel beta-helix repeat-containing protein [Thermoplasmatales archaeon]|nr:right-handed parallel beta-helix repeat-containing protein [Thermoplasmatales archaeon]
MKCRVRKEILVGLLVISVIVSMVVVMSTDAIENEERATETTVTMDNGGYVDYAETQDVKDGYKYASHEPIYIDGNDDFVVGQNGVVSGNGTESDPYIIEGWDIDASSANGIEIKNTDVYFIIRTCVIHDGKSNYNSGIFFYNVINGKIDNATSYNNSGYGILLSSSSNNTISNCAVYNNSYYGIYLSYYSNNNQIINCALYNNSHSIWIHWYSNNNQITNCAVYNNSYYGIYLISSSNNNNITNCYIYNNSNYGIYLDSSSNNEVHYCNIYNNTNYGIYNYNTASEYQVNATYNWWGSANGPGQDGANPVTSNVIYDPWLTDPWEELTGPVHNINKDTYYDTIQEAIDDANSGDTIEVSCGTYYENVVIDKTLTLIGEDRNTTIIDGNGTGDVIYISADWVNVNGFGVRNCGVTLGDAGIEIKSSNNNCIRNCTVCNNTLSGIYLYYYSTNNTITNCNIYNNAVGIFIEDYSNSNIIINCTISSNSNDGIVIIYSSTNNLIYHNNFISNAVQAYDSCSNYWDNDSEGNYWSDYDESSEGAYDNNTDGIVDTPYAIPGGSNVDNYPFMNQSGWEEEPLISHDPISIDGNDDFIVGQNGVVSGSGNEGDPYIIENWDINASSGHGIWISNTDVYFIIRNCVIHDGESNYHESIHFDSLQHGTIYNVVSYNNYRGIYIQYSSNNSIAECTIHSNLWDGIDLCYSSNNNIVGCTIYNNYCGVELYSSSNNILSANYVYNNNIDGIRMHYSSNNNTVSVCIINNNSYDGIELSSSSNDTITNCSVYNNSQYGINLWYSSNNNVTDCDVYNNSWCGIYLLCSSNNNITSNTFTNDGIIIRGDDLKHYTQNIETTNLVNSKPVYYFLNQNNLNIDNEDVGGLILVNCSNFIIKNVDISHTDIGIELAFSTNISITNCAVYGNSESGILLDFSSNNTIEICSVYNNSDYGLRLSSFSNKTIITNCDVYNNDVGILLDDSSNNNLTNCNVYNNSHDGIYLYYSLNSEIHYCNIYNNTNHGIYNIAYQVNATYNWWGSVNGPGQDGANPVTSNVIYDPWLTEPWEEVTGPVHNLDKDTYYDTIQEAIDDANTGDTIEVSDGTYYENIVIDKTLTLIGEDRNNTIIDGSGAGDVVYISADWVNVSELTVKNATYRYGYGIKIKASNSTISTCNILDNGVGIYLNYSSYNKILNCNISNDPGLGLWLDHSSNNLVENCILPNNGGGIEVSHSSSNNLIVNCTLMGGSNGIRLYSSSNNTTITNCIISDGGTAVTIWYSSNNTVTNCNLSNNSRGIAIQGSSANTIKFCDICFNDREGILFEYSTANNIQYCNITDNNYSIYISYSSNYNYIHHNNFINNTNNAYDECSNFWDNGIGEGNYWSDFDEPSEGAYDNNTDGIVDTPYMIPGGSNVDNYPFMEPSGWEEEPGPVNNLDKDTYYNTIQEAIDDADSGDTIEVSNGTYYENVIINKTLTLIGEDRNTTIIDGSGTGDVVYISADGVNVSGFGITNSSSNFSYCGIRISSSNTHIASSRIFKNYQGIYIQESSNNCISNCTVYLNLYHGIRFVLSNNNFISYNNISDNYYGISLDGASHNYLENNQLWNNKVGLDVCGNQKEHFNHTIDSSNKVNEKIIYYLFNLKNQTVQNLSVSHLTVAWCVDIVLKNLSVIGGDGMVVYFTTNSIITNCTLTNSYYGLKLYESANNTIINCSMSNNTHTGIWIRGSNNRVVFCNILNNSVGVWTTFCTNNSFQYCDISLNNYEGISWGYAENSSISYCNIATNNGVGILLDHSSNNTIVCCSIRDNGGYGIKLQESSNNNSICHNMFINNINQAHDECINFWDNGSVGNYWDDYTGVDNDGNGIGDTSYNISDGANVDNYPLIEPVGTDTLKPKITVTSVENNTYYNVDITPVITIFDLNLNTTTVTLNGGDFTSGTMITEEGTYILFVQATDKANNVATKTVSFIIDKTKPDITIDGVADGVYYNVSVTPVFWCSDVNLDTVSAVLNDEIFINGTVVEDEGGYTLVVLATDKAGNNASETISFIIDKTNPSINITGVADDSYYNTDIIPIIEIIDIHLNTTSVTLNGNPFTNGTVVSVGDTYILVVQADDKAGNSVNKTITFIIDKTAPIVTISESSQTTNKNTFTMHWTTIANDVQYYEISTDGINWMNVSTDTYYTFTLSKGDNTLYVRGTDLAGNTGTDMITVTYQEKKQGKPGIIPGFETLAVLVVLGIIILLKRKKFLN